MHSEDLATLYTLALRDAPPGSSYIGAAIEGLAVGRIAEAFARRFGTRRQMPDIISTEALAAEAPGPGAMRLTSSLAARKPDAISAGGRGISLRKVKSRGCRDGTGIGPHVR